MFSVRPSASSFSTTRPDAAVHRSDHPRVDPEVMVIDVGKLVVVRPGRLQRVVDAPVRQEQEERPMLIVLDDLQRFLSVVVGQVAVRLKRLTVVEGRPNSCALAQTMRSMLSSGRLAFTTSGWLSGRYSSPVMFRLSSKP